MAKPPSTKNSVAKQVEALPSIGTIDVMLLEGTAAADVAKFIQKDQGQLTDVNEKTLINVLLARKLQRQEVTGYFGAGMPRVDIDDLDDSSNTEVVSSYRRRPQTPGTLARKMYEGIESKLHHMQELEALYLASRDRIDRWMELEYEVGAFSDRLGAEMVNAANIVTKHFDVAKELGLVEAGDHVHLTLDISKYSKRTADVLSDPASRHRVLSIVERIAQHVRRGQSVTVDEVKEKGFSLPLPKASGGDDE